MSKNATHYVLKLLFQIQVLYNVKNATHNVIIAIPIPVIALNAYFRGDIKHSFIITLAIIHALTIILQTMILIHANVLLY
jgi:hypothetical protein